MIQNKKKGGGEKEMIADKPVKKGGGKDHSVQKADGDKQIRRRT